MSRQARLAAALALLGVAAVALLLARPPSPEERAVQADAIVAGITAEVSVAGSGLVATTAIADFGVGQAVRLVRVRIVDELQLELRIESVTDVVLAQPIVACLVGPDAAPDDAGLSEPCWGEPQLGALLEAELPPVDGARSRLRAGTPVVVSATIRRGDARCDYPPGMWHLELRIDPVVGGEAAGPRYAPDAAFEVPFDREMALRPVDERRYCGLANKVYREQGEPDILDD